MAEATDTGIYIGFQLDSSPAKKFLNDFPESLGAPVEVDEVHVSVMYPEELAAAGLALWDLSRLRKATREVSVAINNLRPRGQRIDFEPDQLHPFKKFIGLKAQAENDLLYEARALGVQAINEALGIRLSLNDSFHASIARTQRRCKKPIPFEGTPTHMIVSNFFVGQRPSFIPGFYEQPYINGGAMAASSSRI